MVTIIDGKLIAEKKLDQLKKDIAGAGIRPCLATVIVGEDPASQMYVRMKHKACERVGIESLGISLPENTSTNVVLGHVKKLNENPDVNGILVQLPLPGQIKPDCITAEVCVEKDVDGYNPANLGLLFSGKPRFVPCTPKGIMTLLSEYKIPVPGAQAVVLGRSVDVGRPMAALLTNADATVTVCHSRTRDISAEARRADILISAVGKAHFITKNMVQPGAVVIDVGINQLDGKLVGDVDYAKVTEVASAITPVPGGVGPMTIATLMENTFTAAKEQSCRNVS